jgi:hypothetical protein
MLKVRNSGIPRLISLMLIVVLPSPKAVQMENPRSNLFVRRITNVFEQAKN